MSSIDERTVKMQFDNDTFMKRARDTQKTLADVNKSVDSTGKSKGLLDLNSNMEKVSVTASKMQVITTTALATIANKATNVALNLAKSLTFAPISQGFHEYEALLTKQNVMMNATGKSAKYVKGILNDLNHYSDQTIFSFGDMTEAMTGFVNAGVPLKQASAAMKGIANASALAGASTQESQSSFRAFSQALGQGFLGLQDFRQAAITGKIGTVQFKQNLIDTAVQMGKLTKRGSEYVTQNGKVLTATKGFDMSLQSQWASAEVLNKALGRYSDTNTKLGKKAMLAATQVRTFSAFMDTLKESLGSGWAQVFTNIFGGLNKSTKMWTNVSNAVGGVVNSFFKFLNTSLKVWRQMGGFEKTIQGFKNLLAPFAALLNAIGDAWSAAFPNSGKGAGKALYGLSAGFEALTRPLQWLATAIGYLVNPLTLIFSLIRVGGQVIGRVIGDVKDFVSSLIDLGEVNVPSGGGILGYIKLISSAVSDALKKVGDLIAKGASLKDALGSFSIDLPGLPDMSNPLGGAKAPSGGGSALKSVASDAQAVGSTVLSVFAKIGEGLVWIKDQMAEFFQNFTAEDVVASFNLAVLTTLAISIARFLNQITGSVKTFKGIGKDLRKTLGEAQGALSAYQDQAKAKKLMYYAAAIALLAGALWVLSKIPVEKLVPALAAMGALFFMLNKTMENFTKQLKGTDGVVKGFNFVALAVSIVLLAGAMILLATACLIMNKVEWQSIAKGIIVMATAMKLMESIGDLSKGAAKNMIGGAAAIALVAGSMIILAGALLLFKLVDWESMGKAGVALAGISLAVGLLAMIPYEGIAKVGAALLLASVGMLAIANALILFALVKWSSIGKAAVVLLMLTVSLAVLMAVGGPASVAAMLGLAGAMIGLAVACLILNKVDWESIGKAAVILTVLLAALAVGAVIMTAFLYAIAPVSPVLIILAAGFFLLGLGLLAFAAAMAIAITLGAAGVAAFAALATGAAVAVAVFLQTLASEAPIMKDSFLKILQALIDTIVEAVPMVIQGIKDLWAAVKKEFTSPDKGKDAGEAGKSWVEKIGDGIKKVIPKIAKVAVDLLNKFLQALDEHLPEILTMGLYFVTKLIEGIGNRIGGIVDAAVNLVIKFAKALGENVKKITDAGVQLMADFLHGLADSIRQGSGKIGDGVKDVASAMGEVGLDIVKGLAEGIGNAGHLAVEAAKSLAESLPGWVKKVLGIKSPSRVFKEIGKFLVEGLTQGIQDNAVSAITAVASMVSGQIAVASAYVSKFVQGLDQQAIAARAKADGLASAADKAARAAERQQAAADKAEREAQKTKKNKKDDKAARRAGRRADAAADAAEKIDRAATAADRKAALAEERAAKAAEKEERNKEFERSSLFEQAQMRSEDAQASMDEAKDAERRAAADLAAAKALEQQAKAKGVSKEERKKLEKEAERLRARAKTTATDANNALESARLAAADALVLQQRAGEEAARMFQEQYEAEAKADKESDEFDKLKDEEKAAKRREQAAALQAQADKDLADAKKLAYTDLEAANDLAQVALDTAQKARDYLDEADRFDEAAKQGMGTTQTPGTVVNLDPTEAASIAFNRYADTYDQAVAAAATGPGVEFNQYITSPDPADPVEVYRRTNNLLDFAAPILNPAA